MPVPDIGSTEAAPPGMLPRAMPRAVLLLPVFLLTWLAGCAEQSTPGRQIGHRNEIPGRALADPAAGAASIRFRDVSAAASIRFSATNSRTSRKYLVETIGSGCAFIDYDRDGWPDILLLNGRPLEGQAVHPAPTLKLYHNNRDGTFTDVTAKAGLAKTMFAMGCAVGDYDNDGYDDIYISCVLGPGHLFHNNGNGTFTDVTAAAGVGNSGNWGTSCAWVDVDNDGWLDLFVCNYVRYRSLKDDIPCTSGGEPTYCIPSAFAPSHCVLYHNNHNGAFTDISERSGIAAASGKSLGVAVSDVDHVGRPDLYVANDGVAGFLFQNRGNNRFQEIGVASGTAFDPQGLPHGGMGIDIADVLNHGKLSLVVTNYSGQQTAFYDEIAPGAFRDDTESSRVGPASLSTLGFGAFFFDCENDGFKDLFVANGHVQDLISRTEPAVTYAEVPFLYRNLRNGKFQEIGSRSGPPFQQAIVARGAAYGDYDNDGKLDILVTTSGGPAYLWHNETANRCHWLTLRLVGTRSNRDGIGSVIVARCGGSTQTVSVRSGSSYLSACDLRAHFGLGSSTAADLEVRWPSGTVDRIAAAPADQIWTIVEGSGRLSPSPNREFARGGPSRNAI